MFNLDSIEELCLKHEKKIPTEVKLIHDVENDNLKVDCGYDLYYTNRSLKDAYDAANE